MEKNEVIRHALATETCVQRALSTNPPVRVPDAEGKITEVDFVL